jgi:NAD(P)-dependent dehydrogenase (short-subunit alcohol dehydrogenase family)
VNSNYKNMFSLEGKKAVIAGGAGGLGSQISLALMQNGADIAIADINISHIKDIEKQTTKAGRKHLGIKTDILNPKSIEKMVDKVISRFGGIDILINVAGINILKKAEDYDEKTWDKVLDINLKGTHLVTKAVGRQMISRNYGRILSMSSVRSILGMPQDYTAYCASKGAINMYTKQIACEWAKYGITCNAIAPTFIRTPINSFQLDDPEFYKSLVDRIPLGRICTTRDICAAIVYLVSDAAEFVTGQILGVDGGITIIQ